jgi:uncharacterized OB-fold protein
MCAWQGFPERLWCPGCGSDEVDSVPAEFGVVEDATVMRRAPGRTVTHPVKLGTVAVDGGGHIVSRLEAEPGERIRLSVEDGAPVARPDSRR